MSIKNLFNSLKPAKRATTLDEFIEIVENSGEMIEINVKKIINSHRSGISGIYILDFKSKYPDGRCVECTPLIAFTGNSTGLTEENITTYIKGTLSYINQKLPQVKLNIEDKCGLLAKEPAYG